MKIYDLFDNVETKTRLLEGRDAPLYQMMRLEKVRDVFYNDVMPARHTHDIPGYGKAIGNSFTRNPRLVWWGVVWLQVDQTRLARTHKIIPVDGEYVLSIERGAGLDSEYRDRKCEHLCEEFVIGDIKALHQYVTKITVLNSRAYRMSSQSEKVEIVRISKAYAERWGIALVVEPPDADLVMRTEGESYSPPDIETGDVIKIGKFKNKKATVTGFSKDDHNQPVLKTTKGDATLFKPRIAKLEENAKRIEINGHTFVLLKNPNIQQVLNLFERSKAETLRGLVVGIDIYWWDSYYAWHGHIAELVMPNDDPARGYWENPEFVESRLILDYECSKGPTLDCSEKMLENPRVVALLKSDKIFLLVPGVGGLKYSQYLAFQGGQKDWWNARLNESGLKLQSLPSWWRDGLDESLKAFHGTRSPNLVFKLGHTGNNSHTFGHYDSQRWGAFFTDNPDFASMYGKVSEYQLNISNTLDCENDNNLLWHYVQGLDAFDPKERPIWQEGRNILRDNPPRYWLCFEGEFGERFVAHLRELGFDSATFTEYNEDDGGTEHKSRTIVVFDVGLISRV